ncbi:hypothetical protein TIFTF001_038340 [Ficus carica]|uniref:Uncharacterized protein n=1 Tax=Ficus carica TaxID=3494 RepID=A0AA88J9U7_FICCA|nr:hypothetical protein TIFTF001_038340 [Ficus carica]
MLFVVRGHLQSYQVLRDGLKSCCMLGPGNFSGDELLSWCLRCPFIERLPPSSSMLVTVKTTEAFGLEAVDVKYVTQHFRYTFVNEKVKRSARYYSPDLGGGGDPACVVAEQAPVDFDFAVVYSAEETLVSVLVVG